jgi:hypothetical protein
VSRSSKPARSTRCSIRRRRSGQRVTILAIDAGSLISSRARRPTGVAELRRVLDAGAVMHLATIHPTSAEAV